MAPPIGQIASLLPLSARFWWVLAPPPLPSPTSTNITTRFNIKRTRCSEVRFPNSASASLPLSQAPRDRTRCCACRLRVPSHSLEGDNIRFPEGTPFAPLSEALAQLDELCQ